MDKIDAALLESLQEDARTPIKTLTKKVFLSAPAISARIEKLERQGIIRSYCAELDPIKLGYHIKAFINLQMTPDQKTEFYPFIRQCRNVLECDCVTGDYSMLIKVAYPSTAELDTFIGQLQHFGVTSTQIVFSTPVESRGVQVDPELAGN
ncbi:MULTISPECIES: Lrp/AsnC family transcriptional regulator [Caproicibacterium]|uniref:AsnC family transcriptional regulator n=1 Tax=Caproicibacterium lactatifermentans TaxID=2666138 RepID=A0A859DVI4_9FIRM|nr:Lrp/AsnC family transcriptional regulator [Caproicibacterium lactatifermentans]ARP51249.1 AsnC family transcriptional regulator [Ruminococcaceae bacterium CPB6]QKN24343.1 AsnC family transcriptional regulator [Caproicibacterium lactatifermentans]QKO31210.1 AsnC family transcriptional regulator [Caproicibacterium lactatifermentans]